MATQTYPSLHNLLYNSKIIKGSAFTHTCMKGGAYYIKSEYIDQFHKLYTNELLNNTDLYITEKHSDIAPVLIDFDLRFHKDETERKYTTDLIDKSLLNTLIKLKVMLNYPKRLKFM